MSALLTTTLSIFKVLQKVRDNLLENADVINTARLLAVSGDESGAWLNALPIATTGNLLDDESLRIAVALRLGAEVCGPHECICGATMDKFGHHGLSCGKSKGRYARHAAINDAVSRALESAKVPCRVEPNGLCSNDAKRPDGMTIYPWSHGKALIWDVTVVDTLAPSYIGRTSANEGAAAEIAEESKIRKYEELRDRFLFIPVAFETLGCWGEEAKSFIGEISRRIVKETGNPRALEFLRQRISLEIQRGNAICVTGTVPDRVTFDQLFYV